MLRHSAPHFMPISEGTACRVWQLNAAFALTPVTVTRLWPCATTGLNHILLMLYYILLLLRPVVV